MEMSFGYRLKHAWNAFTGNVQTNYRDLGMKDQSSHRFITELRLMLRP